MLKRRPCNVVLTLCASWEIATTAKVENLRKQKLKKSHMKKKRIKKKSIILQDRNAKQCVESINENIVKKL